MAFGLKPVRYMNGAPWDGKMTKYYKSASVILGIGDPVVLSGTADSLGVPAVTRAAAASGTITGVFMGMDPNLSDLTKRGMAAADAGYCYVVDDPNVIFQIEEDGDTTPVAAADVGEFADLATVGNANTTTWVSTVQLDSSTASDEDQLRILGLSQIVGNAIMADTSSTKGIWDVIINEHTYKAVQTPV